MIYDPTKRHEFVLLFDVKNGNPNGDPDAGNLPRVDPETRCGLVTDVALKRKVRDYVTLTRGEKDGYRIFIQTEDALNTLIERAGDEVDVEPDTNPPRDDQKKVRDWMCGNYFDIRMFGAVLSTGDLNAGQVRGPAQLAFAQSIDPVLPMDISITRQARTTEERMETGSTEMGRKSIIPYGLYRAHGYLNPFLAEQTGVTEDDLEVLWESLANLFEFDRSAARGEMATRGLYVFNHESKLGNARANELLEKVQVQRREDVENPRSFSDYEVTVDTGLPDGVTMKPVVEG